MAEPATDLITDLESGGIGPGTEFTTWTQLLANTQNMKGCIRAELQRFHGRNGMQTFAASSFVDASGKPISDGGTVPELNAAQVAHQFYNKAILDGRRHGCDTYRLQLVVLRKRGKGAWEETFGEYAGLRFNIATGEAVWGASNDENSVAKGWKEIAEFLRDSLKDLMGKSIELEGARTNAMLTTVQAGEILIERRMQHAARVEQMAPPPPTPKETNERIRMGLNAFTGTMRELVRFAMWNKTGTMPPREPAQDVGAGGRDDDADDAKLQTELRDFFDGLSGEQHDKLKDMMGAGNFAGVIEVLHGDLENFQRNFVIMGPMLGQAIHDGRLDKVLSPDEMKRLRAIFGV